MTKMIIVLYARESLSVTRVLARLQAHFGDRRVQAAAGRLPTDLENCVIVALFSATQSLTGDNHGGLPVDNFAAWTTTGLDTALASDCRILPMLIDNAVMPAHTSIPEPFRKIAFKHALPIRCGDELDRDVGRLISDLEQHLQYSPANVFAWDSWLVPVGAAGVVICSPFLVLWLWDAWYWNYAYATAARYQQACWWLTGFGPILLGVFLLVMSGGLAYRQYRQRLLARSAHFHTGQGSLPVEPSPWLVAARIFTWTSLGWGWWVSGLAMVSLIAALVRDPRPQTVRPSWRWIALVLVGSTGAAAWGLWRDHYTGQLERALRDNELGRIALDAGKIDEAKSLFDSAIRVYPNLGRSHESLGLWYARQQQNEEAYREFSRAISIYPTGDRGLLGPDKKQIAGTHRYRAQVAQALGKTELAEADEKRAAELMPFLDIFGGFLRFW